MRKFACIMVLLSICWGAYPAQDSIKVEAKRVTQRQIDSIKVRTRGVWYISPNIMDNSIKNLLVKLNEEVIKGNEQNRLAFKNQDSLSRALSSAQQDKIQTLYALSETNAKTQKLQNYFNFVDHCLIVFFTVLFVIFMVQNTIGVVRRYKRQNRIRHATKGS